MTYHTSQTLVLGTAIGYTQDKVAPFLKSLGRTGYIGTVALVVDKSTGELLKKNNESLNVILIETNNWVPVKSPLFQYRLARYILWHPVQYVGWACMHIVRYLGRLGILKQESYRVIAERILHPQLSRYFVYLRYLESSNFKRVLISDVRDVLFQSDPFSGLPDTGLAISVELEKFTIGKSKWNSKWIQRRYGADVLAEIAHNPISCSGVTYGDSDSMRKYLTMMTREFMSLSFNKVKMAGDQGIHNVLLWTGKYGQFARMDTFSSPVATLNAIDSGDMKRDDEGYLLNQDGSRISVIHQYDRFPKLVDELLVLLAGSQ